MDLQAEFAKQEGKMSELQLLVNNIAPLIGESWKPVEPDEGGDWRSFAEGPSEMRLFFW